MRTFKVLGGPGCGKTTEILNRLGRKFREGLNPSQVLMIGFVIPAADVSPALPAALVNSSES